MAQTNNTRPGEAGPGTGIKTAGETCRQSTRTADNLAAWHEQTDWEAAHQYAEGWAAGYAAAERAIAEEITRAVGVKPYDRRDVIRWLVRTIDQPREPYSSPANGTTLGVAERDVLGRWAA